MWSGDGDERFAIRRTIQREMLCSPLLIAACLSACLCSGCFFPSCTGYVFSVFNARLLSPLSRHQISRFMCEMMLIVCRHRLLSAWILVMHTSFKS